MDYKGYLIDLDGTIYRGTSRFLLVAALLSNCRRQIPFLFVTNNTTKTPETVANRLANEFEIHVAQRQSILRLLPRLII